jgi:hypothetical protein
MKRLMILGIITCVGLLLAPAAFAGDPKGPPGGLGVEIVNPLPVPVTGDVDATVSGDVSIVNQPTVDAMQSGNWSVTVDDSNPISVTGQISTFQTREPYYGRATSDSPIGQFSAFFQIPENKILVIEKVQYQLEYETPPFRHAYLGFKHPNDPNPFTVYMPIGPPAILEGGQTSPDSTLVYIDGPYYAYYCNSCLSGGAGSGDFELRISFNRPVGGPEGTVLFYVSGYLLPMVP